MDQFDGRVAVITGAASGIGRGLAGKAAREGMQVVLADVEADALEEAAADVDAIGAEHLVVSCDVSREDDVQALAARAFDAFGAVHLLCNNAGVFQAGVSWQRTQADWDWVFGVNVWGVLHGIRAFVPRILDQGDEAHIVNTASMAGRNRPDRPLEEAPDHEFVAGVLREKTATEGRHPDEVADLVFDAVRAGRFWIPTTDRYEELLRPRFDAMLSRTMAPAADFD